MWACRVRRSVCVRVSLCASVWVCVYPRGWAQSHNAQSCNTRNETCAGRFWLLASELPDVLFPSKWLIWHQHYFTHYSCPEQTVQKDECVHICLYTLWLSGSSRTQIYSFTLWKNTFSFNKGTISSGGLIYIWWCLWDQINHKDVFWWKSMVGGWLQFREEKLLNSGGIVTESRWAVKRVLRCHTFPQKRKNRTFAL